MQFCRNHSFKFSYSFLKFCWPSGNRSFQFQQDNSSKGVQNYFLTDSDIQALVSKMFANTLNRKLCWFFTFIGVFSSDQMWISTIKQTVICNYVYSCHIYGGNLRVFWHFHLFVFMIGVSFWLPGFFSSLVIFLIYKSKIIFLAFINILYIKLELNNMFYCFKTLNIDLLSKN